MRKGEHFEEYQSRIKKEAQRLVEAAAGRGLTVAEFKEACDQAKVEIEEMHID
ncbi:MAG TPA: hypothetical protein H9945_11565 [Candidatus Gemmiger avicola]|uniref:Uncharacterized protein n=1 Tax=Candidatus Gemmiger avicola TaxID=2838605 RepID=A0A9D2M8N2_9FIRM|nr:hypothetical protein [Candidatus Gemmiger avicola]